MAYDDELAKRIRQVFGARRDIAERKMFGGLAFLLRGHMCCGIVGDDLMVRVDEEDYDALLRRSHVRQMDFTGKALRGFVYVSAPGFRTTAALRTSLSRGERVAQEKATRPTARSLSKSPGSTARTRVSVSQAGARRR